MGAARTGSRHGDLAMLTFAGGAMNDSVEDRLAHLERQVRLGRSIGAGLAVTVAIAVLWIISQKAPPMSDTVIRTRGLVVADAKGRERFRVEVSSDESRGETSLWLGSADG